eukprot:4550421-Pleurochrysis_carterae.AAC.1
MWNQSWNFCELVGVGCGGAGRELGSVGGLQRRESEACERAQGGVGWLRSAEASHGTDGAAGEVNERQDRERAVAGQRLWAWAVWKGETVEETRVKPLKRRRKARPGESAETWTAEASRVHGQDALVRVPTSLRSCISLSSCLPFRALQALMLASGPARRWRVSCPDVPGWRPWA